MKTQAVKYKNQIWCEVWKDSDFDVIDLDIQIADLEALIHTQANMLTDVKAENRQQAEQIERKQRRDSNATIELCYDDGENPFARESLKVVDVGVSDNCYVVESEIVKKYGKVAYDGLCDVLKSKEAENQRLKESLGEIAKADKKKIMSESWDFVMACVGDMIYIAEQALAAPPQKGSE